jgi:hypothetical protein
MSPAGFRPTIPAGKRLQTHALDRLASGISTLKHLPGCNWRQRQHIPLKQLCQSTALHQNAEDSGGRKSCALFGILVIESLQTAFLLHCGHVAILFMNVAAAVSVLRVPVREVLQVSVMCCRVYNWKPTVPLILGINGSSYVRNNNDLRYWVCGLSKTMWNSENVCNYRIVGM